MLKHREKNKKKNPNKIRKTKKEKRALFKKGKGVKRSPNLIRTLDDEFRVSFHYGHSEVYCTFRHLSFSHAPLNKATHCLSPKITHMFELSQMSRLNARCLLITVAWTCQLDFTNTSCPFLICITYETTKIIVLKLRSW